MPQANSMTAIHRRQTHHAKQNKITKQQHMHETLESVDWVGALEIDQPPNEFGLGGSWHTRIPEEPMVSSIRKRSIRTRKDPGSRAEQPVQRRCQRRER